MTAPNVAAFLDVAHDLVARPSFETQIVLRLLANLPFNELDVQIRNAVKHAEHAVAAACNGGVGRTVNARFALARLVSLLEAHVKAGP